MATTLRASAIPTGKQQAIVAVMGFVLLYAGVAAGIEVSGALGLGTEPTVAVVGVGAMLALALPFVLARRWWRSARITLDGERITIALTGLKPRTWTREQISASPGVRGAQLAPAYPAGSGVSVPPIPVLLMMTKDVDDLTDDLTIACGSEGDWLLPVTSVTDFVTTTSHNMTPNEFAALASWFGIPLRLR